MPDPSTDASTGVLQDFLTDEELADQLGKSPRTLARWRRLREGPAVTRVGRRLLYRRTSVERWLETLEQEPA